MATSKKPPVGKSLAPAAGKSVTIVGSWRDRAAASMQAMAVTQAKLPSETGNFLSFKGGVISHGGTVLENPLPVVILAVSSERSYYSSDYNPDNGATPDCYSQNGSTPHANAAIPQNDSCASCRFNEFGSARTGSGKACKEGAKIALIHANVLDSPGMIEAAPIVTARVSVLNAKTLRSYMDALKSKGLTLWQDITEITNRPDPKSQYAVSFLRIGADLDDATLDAISAREEAAQELLSQPYPEPREKAAPAQRAAAPVRKSKFQR